MQVHTRYKLHQPRLATLTVVKIQVDGFVFVAALKRKKKRKKGCLTFFFVLFFFL